MQKVAHVSLTSLLLVGVVSLQTPALMAGENTQNSFENILVQFDSLLSKAANKCGEIISHAAQHNNFTRIYNCKQMACGEKVIRMAGVAAPLGLITWMYALGIQDCNELVFVSDKVLILGSYIPLFVVQNCVMFGDWMQIELKRD